MKKYTLIVVALLFCIYPLSIKAQEASKVNFNGTNSDALSINFKNMLALRDKYPMPLTTRSATSFVPVAFHLVGKDDASGRIKENTVLNMLCEWNTFYNAQNMGIQFYLKNDFNYINNTNLYEGNYNTLPVQNLLKQIKKNDAINIFITNTIIKAETEYILKYENRTNATDQPYSSDWILMKGDSSTKNIENKYGLYVLGLYFGLVPTTYGTECLPFSRMEDNTCIQATVNCNNQTYELEKVARTGPTANCTKAGDGFCDTPADYLHPSWGRLCTYNITIKDADCAVLSPISSNIMSFSSECPQLSISNEQKNALLNNYLNLPQRDYIRKGNQVQSTADLTKPQLLSNNNSQYSNSVNLDWSDIEGAVGYIVEFSKFSSFGFSYSVKTNSSNITLNSSNTPPNFLTPDARIFWRIRPYSTYKTCIQNTSDIGNVILSSQLLSSDKDLNHIESFILSPTPLSNNQFLTIQTTSTKRLETNITIYDITGHIIMTEKCLLNTGTTSKNIAITNLSDGIYFLKMSFGEGYISRKFVVKK
jgi:hypothetical protein